MILDIGMPGMLVTKWLDCCGLSPAWACGTIHLVLGDVREALMLLGFVFVVLDQVRKTERALEALRGLTSPVRW